MDEGKGEPPMTASEKQIGQMPPTLNLQVIDMELETLSYAGKKEVDTGPKEITNVGPSSHPLLIDLITDLLVDFVKKKDLPACRRVCKIWNLKIIPRFREEFEVFTCTIHHPQFIPDGKKEFEDGCKPGKDRSLETFVKLMETSIYVPYTKFRLDLNTKGNSRNEFFNTCGPEMTEITLENQTLEPENLASDDRLSNLTENLNKMFNFSKELKSLVFNTPIILCKNPDEKMFNNSSTQDTPMLGALKYVSFNGFQGSRENIPKFFDEFFARTPNVVGIDLTAKFEGVDWKSTSATSEFMFNSIVSAGRVSTLENLTYSFRTPNEFVNQMEKDGTRLKKLCVNVFLEGPIVTNRLMELQKDNLQFLSYNIFDKRNGDLEFPRMKNLKILHVQFVDNLPVLSADNFSQNFPNLRILSFYMDRVGGNTDDLTLDLNILGNMPCAKLESMELHYYDFDLHSNGFVRMTQVYASSSLTNLRLDTGLLNVGILIVIWCNLTGLRELELIFTVCAFEENLDSLLTGISSKDCAKIRNDLSYWNFMNGLSKLDKRKKISELAQQLRFSPSISIVNLKSLRRLFLKVPGNKLTDIMGYFGLYELKQIRHIHIDFCQFTETCCETLKNDLDLESWVFRKKKGSGATRNGMTLGPFGRGFFHPAPENIDIIPPYIYPYEEWERHLRPDVL